MAKRESILELLDLFTGETETLARFDRNIEAPFFLGEKTLCFNADGLIYRMDTDTRRITELPTGFCRHCNNDHVPSPDGTLLAVSHHGEEDRGSRVYIVDLSGKTKPRLVTPDAPSYLHGWSPDGTTLAYCAERNGEYDVYTIPVSGGEERRLTFTKGLNDGPEYAPDGRYLYFNSVRFGLMECMRMDADGGNPVRLTDNGRNNWFPHISPDNRVIAYISYDPAEVSPGDHPADKHVEIRRMRPDGTDDTTVIRFFGGQGSLNVNSFHPDSRHLAFVRYEISD